MAYSVAEHFHLQLLPNERDLPLEITFELLLSLRSVANSEMDGELEVKIDVGGKLLRGEAPLAQLATQPAL